MANERSIPRAMEDTVVRKWIAGQSPEQIVEWIHATNHRRITPVKTSRGSIERFLEEQEKLESSMAPLRTALKLRREAPRHLARLEEILSEYHRLGAETPQYKTVQEARIGRTAQAQRLQSLAYEERSLNRMLRLAGVGGMSTERFLTTHNGSVRSLEVSAVEESEITRYVDDALDASVARRSSAEVAALPARLAPPAPTDGEKSARLEDGSTSSDSGSVQAPVEPPLADRAPAGAIPYLTDPDWDLSPQQREEWQHVRTLVNGLLLAIWGLNGDRAPRVAQLTELIPPEPTTLAGAIVASCIPMLQLPAWLLSATQRQHLECQMKRVNAWLQWFREAACQNAAGRGNWRRPERHPTLYGAAMA